MPEAVGDRFRHRAVFTIPTNRSFADSLVAGLIARFGNDPLALANGRILGQGQWDARRKAAACCGCASALTVCG